jgi:diaminobutyrate-2-oxoglutarate transaminase
MELTKETQTGLHVFEELESQVRSYCRSFPTIFTKAIGSKMWDDNGKEYIDFFAGAGALNYGHNNPKMKEKLIEYIISDGVTHSLDMATKAKGEFLTRFNEVVLKPRKLDYKVMFPGPTGTNTVESALKLARKVTGRDSVISFTNAFHGMTLGALSITGNSFKRHGAGVPLNHSVAMPFDNYLGEAFDTVDYLEKFLGDNGSGVALPAAIILETVQGEGGINPASFDWLRRIEQLCRRWDILLIIDDVQAGCGRTGTFFSFEPAGITPDIVCLSKSIGGYGLPLALTLIKPEFDVWAPGEHNGTFRGNNHAFITAIEALNYWETDELEKSVNAKSEIIQEALQGFAERYPHLEGKARGRGFMQGIACGVEGLAEKICAEAFKLGLIMETSGPNSEVAKVMPALTIDEQELRLGLSIFEKAIQNTK